MIERVGSDEGLKTTCGIGAGTTGKAMCLLIGRLAEKNGRVVAGEAGNESKLAITGRKGPKIGKFYPVKGAKFTSDDRPKEFMPKVTNPKPTDG